MKCDENLNARFGTDFIIPNKCTVVIDFFINQSSFHLYIFFLWSFYIHALLFQEILGQMQVFFRYVQVVAFFIKILNCLSPHKNLLTIFVFRLICWSKPTPSIFSALENPKLKNIKMQTRNIKKSLQAIAYAWKLINNKIDLGLFCCSLFRKNSIRNRFTKFQHCHILLQQEIRGQI